MCLASILASCAHVKNDIAQSNNNIISSQASAAFEHGDYIKAAELYKKISTDNQSDKDALFYYAESLRISGDSAAAIEQYNKILSLDNDSAIALEGKGLAYLQNGELTDALDQFNIVIKKDVSRWRTINAIGIINSINGNNEDAQQYYNMALAISNNNPSIINNIALGLAFGGDKAKGISLLKDALAKMPDEGIKKQRLENNLALLYGISGKMNEAEKILRKNLPEPAVYNNLGFYAQIAADKKLATKYLTKAISSSPVYYDKAENNLKNLENTSSELSGEKREPVKAWRGTHKLPLPSLRP